MTDKCRRTAHCCLLVIRGRLSRIHCKYLSRNKAGYYCSIYDDPDRIGKLIGFGNKCSLRENVKKNYPGCGHNRDEWPLIKVGSVVR